MSEWISLKDRLPEIDQWVLVFFPKNHFYGDLILSLRFYYHNWTEKGEIKRMAMFSNIDRSWRLSDFSYWMPLPKPPEDL